jgi:hypothetical protein
MSTETLEGLSGALRDHYNDVMFGNVMVNEEPLPGELVTVTAPPWAST